MKNKIDLTIIEVGCVLECIQSYTNYDDQLMSLFPVARDRNAIKRAEAKLKQLYREKIEGK